jgi:phosphate transport system substrate-binding protein
MDFLNTFSTLATIIGGVTLVGTFIDYMLNHNTQHPNQKRNSLLSATISVSSLVVILIAQYIISPQSSVFTLAGLPFPGSTLKDNCHISITDFPHASAGSSIPSPQSNLSKQELTISGSSVLYSLFADGGKIFDQTNGTTTIVGKLDSSQGLRNLANDQSDIGLTDFYQRDDPESDIQAIPNLRDYQVAIAPLTLVVSQDLKDIIWNLTSQQIVSIFNGNIDNWRMIGGPDKPITVFNRRLGSGSRVTFEKYVLGTSETKDDLRARNTQALVDLIAKTPGSIGYAATSSLAKYEGKVFPICIDGFGATTGNINKGSYNFWSYEHAYVKLPKGQQLSPIVRSFMNYICSANFQNQDIPTHGLLRINQLLAQAKATHEEEYPLPLPCGS